MVVFLLLILLLLLAYMLLPAFMPLMVGPPFLSSVLSKGGRKLRLISFPILIWYLDCIDRYSRLISSKDFCICRLYRSFLCSDSLIDQYYFCSDFCIRQLFHAVSFKFWFLIQPTCFLVLRSNFSSTDCSGQLETNFIASSAFKNIFLLFLSLHWTFVFLCWTYCMASFDFPGKMRTSVLLLTSHFRVSLPTFAAISAVLGVLLLLLSLVLLAILLLLVYYYYCCR